MRSAGGACSAPGRTSSRPDALLSRGLEVHPFGSGRDLEVWIDRAVVPAGYGWSFPAGEEVRIGVGSFDPRFHVREPTERLAEDLGAERVRYQGNWIPHALRDGTEDGVFFAGDSAGHCLPLTAEGIRTALYFGIACGRELRAVLAGRQTARAGAGQLPRLQRGPRPAVSLDAPGPAAGARGSRRGCWPVGCERWRLGAFVDWSFGHYLNIAHPDFAGAAPDRRPARELLAA